MENKIDKRIEGMKVRLKKSCGSIDSSTMRPEQWKEMYSTDVAYLLQELEAAQELIEAQPPTAP